MLLNLPHELVTLIVKYLLDEKDELPVHFQPVRVLSQVNRALYNFTYPFRFYRITLCDIAEYHRFLKHLFNRKDNATGESGRDLGYVRHIRIGLLERADIWGSKGEICWVPHSTLPDPPMPRLESIQCYYHTNCVRLVSMVCSLPNLCRVTIIWQDVCDVLLLLSAGDLEEVRLILTNIEIPFDANSADTVTAEGKDTESAPEDVQSDRSEDLDTGSDVYESPNNESPILTPVLAGTRFRCLARICLSARGINSQNVQRLCALDFPSLRSIHLSYIFIPCRLVFLFIARHPQLTDVSILFIQSSAIRLSAIIDLAITSYSLDDCTRIAMGEDNLSQFGGRWNPIMISQQISTDGFAFEREVHATDLGVWSYMVTAFGVYVPEGELEIELEPPKIAEILGAVNIESAFSKQLTELNVITSNSGGLRYMSLIWDDIHVTLEGMIHLETLRLYWDHDGDWPYHWKGGGLSSQCILWESRPPINRDDTTDVYPYGKPVTLAQIQEEEDESCFQMTKDVLRSVGLDITDIHDKGLLMEGWRRLHEPEVSSRMRRMKATLPSLKVVDWYFDGSDLSNSVSLWTWSIHDRGEVGDFIVTNELISVSGATGLPLPPSVLVGTERKELKRMYRNSGL
ncbi:hypothetical protein K474DRAFT_1706825 [Panus rudis PR-1116 ss-1]|nr:hypothetical protein K474DRAFT_1706825 [Panus rudis PR-1116 ss-1]